MDNDKIEQKVNALPDFNELKNMEYEYRWKQLESYSIKELESLLRSAPSFMYASEDDRDIFKEIMLERFVKLKEHFKWTKENIKRLVKVSDEFVKTWDEGINKAKKMLETLDKSSGDYHIEIILHPVIFYDEDIEGNIELYDKITAYLNPEYMMSICFNYEPPAEIDIREHELINIKKDLSWNIEGFGIIELKNEYLCYALHELNSHNHWAYQDILNIKKILTEIRITSYGDEF